MQAFIVRAARNPSAALCPVAGRPLLERQLEWLYDAGVDEIFVELGSEDIDFEIQRWLRRTPLGLRVRVLVRETPDNDLLALAEAAAVPSERLVISFASDHLARFDITAYFGEAAAEGVYLSVGTDGLDLEPAVLCICRPGQRPATTIAAQGWGAHLSGAKEARHLSCKLLRCDGEIAGQRLLIPGSKIAPGVWVARGARIDKHAQLRAPAYVGAGSWIQAGAKIGPNCHVGEHVVVSAGAELWDITVPDNVEVGNDGRIQRSKDRRPSGGSGLLLKGLGAILAMPLLATAAMSRRWTRSARQ